MKKLLMIPVFVISLFLLSLPALATEYDSPNAIIWFFNSGFGDPVQAFHDCSEEGNHCMAAVYNDVSNTVDYFYTPDPSDFTSWCPNYPAGSCVKTPTQQIAANFPYSRSLALGNMTDYNNWHLPFGVTFSPANNEYFVWTDTKVYKMPINGSQETLVRDYSIGGVCRMIIGQGEDINDEPFLWFFDKAIPDVRRYYPYNDTLLSFNQLQPSGDWDDFGIENIAAGSCTSIEWARWFYASSDFNESLYMLYNYSRTGISPFFSVHGIKKNADVFLSTWNYSHYWIDGTLYGAKENYPSETDGIYTMTTSDFQSFSVDSLYYAYNTSVNEDINTSWGVRTTNYNFYQFDRSRNTTSSDINDGWGVAFNTETLTNLVVSTRFLDDCIGLNCLSFPAVMNIRVECRDINFTTATTFNNIGNFFIPCSTNVTVVLDTLDFNPVHSETTFDVPCSGTQNIATFELRPIYDLPLFAYDAITFQPISGLTFTLNGETKVTNANGRAVYTVDPMVNTDFSDITDPVIDGSCGKRWQTAGDFRSYSLTTSHSEYQTETETFTLFDYPDEKDVYLDPKGINVIVRVKREDGREIFPDDTGVTRIQGADTTYWYTTQKFITTFADLYPAKFLLVDNRTTFLINLTFTFADTVYTTFQYNGQDYTEFNVTQDNTYTFWFIVSSVQPCERGEDCVPSYCDGTTFFASIGCIDSICEYTNTLCEFFCDDAIGCYKVKTLNVCNSTFDCDSVCTGNFTSEIGFCASDGFCVRDKRVCERACVNEVVETVGGNKTIGICPNLVDCYSFGGVTQSFQLITKISPTAQEVTPIDSTFTCSLNTIGSRQCISGYSAATVLVDSSLSTPAGWISTTANDIITFQDIAATCSEGCNITWEFCLAGCNPTTGTCWDEPSSSAGGVWNAFAAIIGMWGIIFPTIVETTIAWLILSIIIAGSAEYAIGGRFGRGAGIIFGLIMIGMMLGGSFAFQMPWELSIVFTILSGFVVWRMWSPTGGGV